MLPACQFSKFSDELIILPETDFDITVLPVEGAFTVNFTTCKGTEELFTVGKD